MKGTVEKGIEREKLFLEKMFKENLELDFSSLSRTYSLFRVKSVDGKTLQGNIQVSFYNELVYCHDRDPNYKGKLNIYHTNKGNQYASESAEVKYFENEKIKDTVSLVKILKDMGVYKKVVPEKIYKKVTLIVEVDNGFDIDDEKLLDEKLADTFADNKSALIDSKNYEDIDWD